MSRAETERQLRLLMTFRVVIVTTLLVCAFSIEQILHPAETLRPLFSLAAAAYGLVLFYAIADRWLGGTRAFVVLQLIGDALIITAFVGITGGIDSPMSFLYFLPIFVASLLLFRRGGTVLAGISWTLYAALVVFGPGLTVSGELRWEAVHREPGRVIYFLVAHMVAMFAFAILSAYLAERLRTQGRLLAERAGAVARLKALNENIIGSINSGLITTDQDGRINFINRGGTEILGYAVQELERESVESLFGLDPGFLRQTRKRLLAKRRFRFEIYFESKGGRRIFLGIAVSNLHDKAGRPLGYLFIFQDLTEIHALEQEVRLKERMVALGEMAAGMAHELRNPLAAISGSVQYLKGDLKPQGETLELMDIIMRESQRLDQAIRDFLTFARPGEFSTETVDLVKILDDSVKLLRKSREFTDAHTIETCYSSPEIDWEVDENRMKQVFWNLAINALKAMPDGGKLTISVTRSEDGRQLEIAFSDEGVGMNAEQVERYFQPFSGSFIQGTGLGAAIVYRLIQEHGGKIRLDSSRGQGTCVKILFKRSKAGSPPSMARPIQVKVAGG